MKSIFKNWKTTLAGVITIVVSLLTAHGKVNATDATAITAGVGLILANDHDNPTATN